MKKRQGQHHTHTVHHGTPNTAHSGSVHVQHTVHQGTPHPTHNGPVHVQHVHQGPPHHATHHGPTVVVGAPNPSATLTRLATGIAATAIGAAAGAAGIAAASTTPKSSVHIVTTHGQAPVHGTRVVTTHTPVHGTHIVTTHGAPASVTHNHVTVFHETKKPFTIEEIVDLLLDRNDQKGKAYYFRNKVKAADNTKTELAEILTKKLTEIMNGNDQDHANLRAKLKELTTNVTMREVKRFTNHVVKAFQISNFVDNVEVKYARENFLTSLGEFFSALMSLICFDTEPMRKFRNGNAELKILAPEGMLDKLKADTNPDADKTALNNYLRDLDTRIAYQPSFMDGGYRVHATRLNPNVSFVMVR